MFRDIKIGFIFSKYILTINSELRDTSLRLDAHKRTTVFIEASNFYTTLAREITSYAFESNLRNRRQIESPNLVAVVLIISQKKF